MLDCFSCYLQISCSSSSAELGNRVRFPKLFLLCVPDSMQAYGFFAIIKNSNWSKVAIIYEDENLFQSVWQPIRLLYNFTFILKLSAS